MALWVMLPCVTTPFIERWWSMAGLPCLVENLAPYSEAQTTDGRWSLFSTISQTFGSIGRIGQIKFWVSIWGIFGCTISILFGTVSPLLMIFINQLGVLQKSLLFRPSSNMYVYPKYHIGSKHLGYSHQTSVVGILRWTPFFRRRSYGRMIPQTYVVAYTTFFST